MIRTYIHTCAHTTLHIPREERQVDGSVVSRVMMDDTHLRPCNALCMYGRDQEEDDLAPSCDDTTRHDTTFFVD